MSASVNQPAPGALRIVLFGMPDAGKTSLLGALGQAAHTQQDLLKGKLMDPSGRLEELRQRLYANQSRSTNEPIVPYPVRFQPDGASRVLNAVLIDCDGRAANDLIRQQRLPDGQAAPGSLAQAVLLAEVLLLAVDVSASTQQLEAEFSEFGKFLERLQRQRGDRTDISGLPVILVLTKCDRLARPGVTPVQWIEEIETRKNRVHQAFQAFVEHEAVEHRPFGRIDLHIWAMAIQRPAPAAPSSQAAVRAGAHEPYGVAELFRVCLQQAQRYRARQQRSTRLLFGTVAGAGGILTALLALILVFAATRPHPLKSRLPADEPDAAMRLAGPVSRLEAEFRDLQSLQKDPDFGTLPESDKSHVVALAQEIEQYLRVHAQLDLLLAPGQPHSLAEVEDIQLPEERRQDWEKTELARDLQALRWTRNSMDPASPLGWYSSLDRQAAVQKRAPRNTNVADWAEWRRLTKELVQKKPPQEDEAPLENSRITWGMVQGFTEVRTMKDKWENADVPALARLLEISAALGLDPAQRDQPLDISPPGRDAAFKRADWSTRLTWLQEGYPQFAKEFTLTGLPEDGTLGIREAASERYQSAIGHGRAAVRERLLAIRGDSDETVDSWEKLKDWLAAPKELDEWRIVTGVLLRLHKPDAAKPADIPAAFGARPIDELVAFLGAKSLKLELKSIILEIPRALDLAPGKELEINYPTADKRASTLRRTDDGKLSDRTWRYRFEAEEMQTITYKMGEHMSARLTVKDLSGNEAALTWSAQKGKGRSTVFQYESLLLTPHIKGQPAAGVVLKIAEGRLPPLPELFPGETR